VPGSLAASSGRPEKSRLPELTSVTVPKLVVQGDRDPFGVPEPQTLQDGVTLIVVSGDHSLKKDQPIGQSEHHRPGHK
jgi:predicted alpha/beta-hydrolase family hydrolase